MAIRIVECIDRDVAKWFRDAIVRDPATHSYALYDLIYEPSSTALKIAVSSRGVEGYVLAWWGRGFCSIHLWGSIPRDVAEEVFERARSFDRVYVHVHSRELEDLARELARKFLGSFSEQIFIDMVVDRRNFKPYRSDLYEARILDPDRDAEALARVKEVQGRSIGVEGARRLLESCLYVGAFVEGELASIACAAVRLRDAWIVADVFTVPRFRGRGLAKVVTSLVTSIAFSAGARAVALHVREGNEPAIRVYRRLGYREVARKLWIVAERA